MRVIAVMIEVTAVIAVKVSVICNLAIVLECGIFKTHEQSYFASSRGK
jgi:hypothetical protein